MTCILKHAKKFRVTVRLDQPHGDYSLTVTSVSQSQAAAAALTMLNLRQDRLLHIEQTRRKNAP